MHSNEHLHRAQTESQRGVASCPRPQKITRFGGCWGRSQSQIIPACGFVALQSAGQFLPWPSIEPSIWFVAEPSVVLGWLRRPSERQPSDQDCQGLRTRQHAGIVKHTGHLMHEPALARTKKRENRHLMLDTMPMVRARLL